MAVDDWSTTPGSNTTISGINIGENCPPANINNAIRQLMADVKTEFDGLDTGSGNQPLDAGLTAYAALITAANKGLYFTGADAPATYDLTAAGRTFGGLADAAAMLSYLGGVAVTINGTASSGYITIGTFKLQWKDASFNGSGSTSVSYPTSFSSWSRAWCTGGSAVVDAENNNPFVSSSGVSSCSVFNATGAVSGTVFAIGV